MTQRRIKLPNSAVWVKMPSLHCLLCISCVTKHILAVEVKTGIQLNLTGTLIETLRCQNVLRHVFTLTFKGLLVDLGFATSMSCAVPDKMFQ